MLQYHPMVYRSTPEGKEYPVTATRLESVGKYGAYIFRYADGGHAWLWVYDPRYSPMYGAAESYGDALAEVMTRRA